jgi:hypothetical protein
VHAWETHEASYVAYVDPLFVAFGARDATGHMSPPEPSSMGQRGLSITGHAAATEPLREERPYSEPLGMWPLQSPPERGGNP